MTTNEQVPATQNEGWGFWGTMNQHAHAAWPLAMSAITSATRQPIESVRCFLDSCYGRHFADEVYGELHRGQSLQDAVDTVTQRWKTRRRVSGDDGVLRGLPYLTGLVVRCGSIQ